MVIVKGQLNATLCSEIKHISVMSFPGLFSAKEGAGARPFQGGEKPWHDVSYLSHLSSVAYSSSRFVSSRKLHSDNACMNQKNIIH